MKNVLTETSVMLIYNIYEFLFYTEYILQIPLTSLFCGEEYLIQLHEVYTKEEELSFCDSRICLQFFNLPSDSVCYKSLASSTIPEPTGYSLLNYQCYSLTPFNQSAMHDLPWCHFYS